MNHRKLLTTDQLLVPGSLNGQVDNSAFLPVRGAGPAHRGLALSFDIAESRMECNHQGVVINGEAIDLFPAARFRLGSVNDELLPLERDLLRDENGNGYWDLSLSPGRIWSEQDDGQWSRAALPFQLSNILENDTHHGIAAFLYNETETSSIFYQIVSETKTF